MQFTVQIGQVPPSSSVAVGLLGFLDVGVELNEAVWPGCSVDLVSVLALKLPGEVLQEAVGHLLAELPLSECEEAGLLLYDVTGQGILDTNIGQ